MKTVIYRVKHVTNHGDTLLHYTAARLLPQGTLIPKQALCGDTCPALDGEASRRAIEKTTKGVCPKCRAEVLRLLSNPHGPTFALAGHTFHLEEVQEGIHSEETADYVASLYCDGIRIGTVENDGHGGMTTFHASTFADKDYVLTVKSQVEAITRLTCSDGTKIHWYLGDIADEIFYKTTA